MWNAFDVLRTWRGILFSTIFISSAILGYQLASDLGFISSLSLGFDKGSAHVKIHNQSEDAKEVPAVAILTKADPGSDVMSSQDGVPIRQTKFASIISSTIIISTTRATTDSTISATNAAGEKTSIRKDTSLEQAGTKVNEHDVPENSTSTPANQDLTTIDINSLHLPESFTSLPVLLVTYLRSGSTWLGEITQQPPGSFYVFEPFQHLVTQGYYNEGSVCFNNDTCREPRKNTETHTFAVESLLKLYRCKLDSLHPTIFHNIVRRDHNIADQWKYRACLSNGTSKEECMSILITQCQKATQRIVKVIRLSMTVVRKLMDIFPQLKVVHLVRDPRGITNSRLSAGYHMTRQTESHSRDVCFRMLTDVTLDGILKEKYPHRITMVMYEAMAERPIPAAKYIFDFLGFNFTQAVENWVNNHSHGNYSNGAYKTVRSDSMVTAYRWRSSLRFRTVQIIDRLCSNLYETLGYLPMEDEAHLTDLNRKSKGFVHAEGFV